MRWGKPRRKLARPGIVVWSGRQYAVIDANKESLEDQLGLSQVLGAYMEAERRTVELARAILKAMVPELPVAELDDDDVMRTFKACGTAFLQAGGSGGGDNR